VLCKKTFWVILLSLFSLASRSGERSDPLYKNQLNLLPEKMNEEANGVVQATEEVIKDVTISSNAIEEAVSPQDDSVSVDQDVSSPKVEETPAKEAVAERPAEEKANVPYNQNPEFNGRIEQIQQKMQQEYGEQSKRWNAIVQAANEDPEFGLAVIERLERLGEVPKGSHAQLKATYEQQNKPEEKKAEPDSDIVSQIESHPLIQKLKQQEEQEKQVLEKQKAELGEFLVKFEENKPEIHSAENPALVRGLISQEAYLIRQKNPDMPQADAMEQAYRWVCKRDEVLEEYREKGEVSGIITSTKASIATPSGGSQSNSSEPSLTASQAAAAKSLGLTPSKYLEYMNAGEVAV